jgi:hypothetical protein
MGESEAKSKQRKPRARPASRRRRPSFYSDQFSEQELSLIAASVEDLGVDDEIWMQRVLNRRLLQYTRDEELPVETVVKVMQAMVAATGRVARLLRDRRALGGEAAESIAGAMATVLDEFALELERDL